MFNQKQQALIIAAAAAAIVFMIGLIGGMTVGAAIVWGLLIGGVLLQLRRQDVFVAEGRDILGGLVAGALDDVRTRAGVKDTSSGTTEDAPEAAAPDDPERPRDA